MINIETLENNVLKITISGKINENDFLDVGPRIDQFIKMYGTIKVLGDATAFEGWSDMKAAEKHFTFVREHQKKIERLALIAGHEWQHWIAGIMSVFVHPEVKVFDKDGIIEAEGWLTQKKAA